MEKLNQIVAIEKSVKTRTYGEVTRLHSLSKKPALFSGFAKTYTPKEEGADVYPPEKQTVQCRAHEHIEAIQTRLRELFDLTITKDRANGVARANVEVDGDTIISDVPATTLLFLEKQLTDLKTFVDELPVLDEAEQWVWSEQAGLYYAQPQKTVKTKKVQRPIVLYDATKEHPAQTQIVTEDLIVGSWDSTKMSGAISRKKKEAILDRIVKLSNAVKAARAKANETEAPSFTMAASLFKYVFNGNEGS